MSRFEQFEYMTSAFPKRLNMNGIIYVRYVCRYRKCWKEAVKEAYHIKNRLIKEGVSAKILKGKLFVYIFMHEEKYNKSMEWLYND